MIAPGEILVPNCVLGQGEFRQIVVLLIAARGTQLRPNDHRWWNTLCQMPTEGCGEADEPNHDQLYQCWDFIVLTLGPWRLLRICRRRNKSSFMFTRRISVCLSPSAGIRFYLLFHVAFGYAMQVSVHRELNDFKGFKSSESPEGQYNTITYNGSSELRITADHGTILVKVLWLQPNGPVACMHWS